MKIISLHEEHKRSALKAVSWRIIATSVTMLLVYVFTGEMELSASIGIFDVVLKMMFYFFHERAWNKISFGRSIGGTVESAMRSPPVTILPVDSVPNLVHKMINSNIGAVIVGDDKKPIGLVTEKDILERVYLSGEKMDKMRVKDIMTSPLTTIDYKESLMKVLKKMTDKQIRRLVVTKNGKAIGTVTERRILEALCQKGE